MNLDQALLTFIEECRELLSDMEDSLLRISSEADCTDHIHAIFRAAHTIKGSAGLFGLNHLVAFTHVAESLLDEVREGQVALQPPLQQLLLQSCDHLRLLVDALDAPAPNSDMDALHTHSEALMQALHSYRAQAVPQAADSCDAAASASTYHTDADADADADASTAADWHIAVRFGPTVLQNGMDPLSFIRYLHTLGEVLHTETQYERVPPLSALDAEQCFLGFVIHIRSHAGQQALEEVFEFVRDDCALCITPLIAPDAEHTCANALSCSPAASGLEPACSNTASPAQPAQTVHATQPATQAAAPQKQRSTEMSSVRVDAHKLDQLINLVGELIIASAGANEMARQLRHPGMQEANATLADLVEQVRDQALQLRMVKIGGTFNKFQRVVHDVARELGKDIALHVSGEDTELDKTVVERIGDPLTHLVRNAMDHGIEPAEQRMAQGKPAQGQLSLNAYHESGYIVIEISDDGGGLDRDRILAKGIERGLVEPGRTLSDQEVYALIFEPGFSTAEHITNLSGRGVGMDVVRSNIAALRGTVELRSTPGLGTTVQVRLPLTLAIINGFQVRVGQSIFVIPLEMVDECIEFTGPANNTHCYTDLRGSVLPFVPLHSYFALTGPRSARPNIVVIQHGSQRFGLLVDELLGEAQTVIKPLSRLFSHAHGISGSSILGNGNVALILDIPVLHSQLLSLQAHSTTPPTAHASHFTAL